MADKKLGVGIIGLGGIAFAHEAGYFEMGEVCRIVATCDIREEEAVSRAALYDAKAYTRYQDLLADPAVDMVDIIVPHVLHYEIAKAALEKGKHVLVEKPITVKSEQGAELIALAKQKRLKFGVAENTRFVTAYLKAEEILESGILASRWSSLRLRPLIRVVKIVLAVDWPATRLASSKAGSMFRKAPETMRKTVGTMRNPSTKHIPGMV